MYMHLEITKQFQTPTEQAKVMCNNQYIQALLVELLGLI